MPLSSVGKYDVLIAGGGAAGLMCAIEAGKRGRRVLVLDHSDRIGRKIQISGGGRCNFTNLGAAPENYLSQNPDFCKSALARYTPWDFIALVEKHRIAYHEKKLGQQFCDGSSREIIEMLLSECDAAGVEIRVNTRIHEVRKPAEFLLETSSGQFKADSLVVSTGGLSFPKIGASGFGYRVAEKFGHAVIETRPGLVPLTLSREWLAGYSELSGVSLDCVASSDGTAFRENILFTHRGLSGPAILQISSHLRESSALQLNLLPGLNAMQWIQSHHGKPVEFGSLLSQLLPRRFAEKWATLNAPRKLLKQWKNAEAQAVAAMLNQWIVPIAGTEGYAKAEVTLGGVDTRELSSKTMESRKVRGLYFIGEVVDVTGWLGGYNFQWAWASGYAAGQAV
jgi:predicted Rossmann fold flavoprotein